MSYWTFDQFKATREKINPVSAFWGKKPKDSRSLVYQYIDAKVSHLANESTTYQVSNLDFAGM